uniref:Uncharacterized protein n=1 Tax=Clandestinovirus TaxID=2831644 RepID=A0A8F8PKB9_9VIRU|nr:hypothetical protein KOM_12_337 [Clandestinovirus]
MAEKVTVECDESGNPYVIKGDGKRFRLYQKGPTFGLKTSVAPRGHGKFLIEFNPRTNKLVCKPKSANDKIKGAKYQMYLRNGLLICRRTLPAGAKAPKEEKEEEIDEVGSQTMQIPEDEVVTNGEPMEVVAEEPIAVPTPTPVPVAAPAAKKAPPKAAAKKAPSAKPKVAGAAKKVPAKKVAKK